MKITFKHVAIIAGLGLGGYLLYRFWKTAGGAINNAANAVAKPIAELINWATMPPAIKANYNFILPNGARINGGAVSIQMADGYNPQFNYNGINYTVVGRDSISNDYTTSYASLNDIYAAQNQNLIQS